MYNIVKVSYILIITAGISTENEKTTVTTNSKKTSDGAWDAVQMFSNIFGEMAAKEQVIVLSQIIF